MPKINKIINFIKEKSKNKKTFVGIVGAPCSGKSTISKQLIKILNKDSNIASLLSMDGFHYDNKILKNKNMLDKKGSYKSFDVIGFLSCIKVLKQAKYNISVPIFDRKKDITIANTKIIKKNTKIVLIEGNYLLLNKKYWQKISSFLDISIFLDVDMKTLKQRAINRWIYYGLKQKEAKKRVINNDMKNTKIMRKYSKKANFILKN